MRRILISLILAALPAAAFAASLGVPLDQAVRLSLSAPAQSIVVGNPAIADVNLDGQRHLIVTGKSNGVTNLIVIDARGRTIFDRQIVVSASAGEGVTLIAGPVATRYACSPQCETSTDVAISETAAMSVASHAGWPAPAPAAGAVAASPTTP
jgi:hypothetical protein